MLWSTTKTSSAWWFNVVSALAALMLQRALLRCLLWLLLLPLPLLCSRCFCCCSARASVQCQAFCFVVAALVFVYRNRNLLPFPFWLLLLNIIASKTYNLSSLLLLSSLLAAAWVATAAAAATTFLISDSNFRFVVFATSSHYVNFHTALHKHTHTHTDWLTDTHTYSHWNLYVQDTNHHAYISICRRRHSPTCTLSLTLCVPLTIARLLFNLLRRTRLLHAKTQSVLTARVAQAMPQLFIDTIFLVIDKCNNCLVFNKYMQIIYVNYLIDLYVIMPSNLLQFSSV